MTRLAAWRRGRRAEFLAALRLAALGWRVVARNLREHGGEIDLVVRRGGTVAFVEVKTRASLGAALEAVHARQRRRIARAALTFLARRPDLARLTPRFDVVTVVGLWPRHLPNAWTPDE